MTLTSFIQSALSGIAVVALSSSLTTGAFANSSEHERFLPTDTPCAASVDPGVGTTSASTGDSTALSGRNVPISARSVSAKYVKFHEDERVTGGPGETISISQEKGQTFSVAVSASMTAEAGVLLAKASATTGISLTTQWTASRTYSSSWTVPKSYTRGYLAIGNPEYSVRGVVKYSNTQTCQTFNKTVTVRGIKKEVAFAHGRA